MDQQVWLRTRRAWPGKHYLVAQNTQTNRKGGEQNKTCDNVARSYSHNRSTHCQLISRMEAQEKNAISFLRPQVTADSSAIYVDMQSPAITHITMTTDNAVRATQWEDLSAEVKAQYLGTNSSAAPSRWWAKRGDTVTMNVLAHEPLHVLTVRAVPKS